MATNGDQIADKIRAILRKADESKNPSEAERETALRLANRLLLKHGLSMADLGDIDDSEDDGRTFGHDRLFEFDQEESWRGTLLYHIAKVYFCKVYYNQLGGGRRRAMIVGRADYVATTLTMYEFIVPQIESEFNIALVKLTKTTSPHQMQQARLARQYATWAVVEYQREHDDEHVSYRDLDDDDLAEFGRERFDTIAERDGMDAALRDVMTICGLTSMHYAKKARAFIRRGDIAAAGVENLAVWRRSFYDAAAHRIGKRLAELMAEEASDMDSGVALVKSEAADLDRFFDSLGVKLRSKQSQRQVDYHGNMAGRAAGDRADLNPNRKVRGGEKRQLGN